MDRILLLIFQQPLRQPRLKELQVVDFALHRVLIFFEVSKD